MLQHAVESLPPEYCAVLVLRDVEHLTIRQTAEVLGTSDVRKNPPQPGPSARARHHFLFARNSMISCGRWPMFSRWRTTIALASKALPGLRGQDSLR